MDILEINFDALKKPHWSGKELENAKLVAEFVQLIMNNHDFDQVLKKYSGTPYRQHNRTIPDGLNGVIETVTQFSTRFPEFTYDVKHIYVDGDRVTLHSHATMRKSDRGNDKKGLNIVDTWKVQDGKLVEHWDAVQPIDWFMRLYALLTGGNIRNGNGVF